MRRKGTSEQLAIIRNRGLALLAAGKKPKEVAEMLNVTPRCVYRWRQESQKPKRKKATRPLGRPRKITEKQVKRLEKALDKGAFAFGYAGDYWTLDRIAQIIWQLFKVRYHPSTVWYVMDRTGWSNQRPQRRAFQRNEAAIEQWKKEVLPEIKKTHDLNATLSLEDEAGFTMVSPLKRTWSRRGQTPVIRTSIDHHDRLNILGVLLVSPKGKKIRLSIKSYWRSITGEEVIAFLKQILRRIHGCSVLVWDRHPIHKRKAVQNFIQSQTRLTVFEFPVAAPELNPAEFLWTQTVEYVSGTAPHDKYELQANVFAGISRTRISQSRLFSCLHASKLDWIN